MRRPSGQISMLVLDIEEWLPENHLLRKINQLVSFDFIYDLAALYYPASSRPSVDPVSMFKILLGGIPIYTVPLPFNFCHGTNRLHL